MTHILYIVQDLRNFDQFEAEIRAETTYVHNVLHFSYVPRRPFVLTEYFLTYFLAAGIRLCSVFPWSFRVRQKRHEQ